MMRNVENNYLRRRFRTPLFTMTRRRIAGGFAPDRISNLPCHIIENILKCLPLHDVVRTSILSREWRHQWVTLPNLDFGEDFAKSLHEEFDVETIVNHVLARHRGPIVKFQFYQQQDTGIDEWLHLLVNHPIEELVLQFQFDPPHNLVPQQMFRFGCLKHLYLGHAEVQFTDDEFAQFASLVKLELDRVIIAPEYFEIFISKCPRLEILIAFECTTPRRLMIDAPNLKSFEFQGKFSSIFFANANLEEILIEGIDGDALFESLGTKSNLIKVFGQLPGIRRLKSDEHFLKFLAVGDAPQKLPNNLNYLTNIELSCVDFENLDIVACVVCLIRSSPNLQSLEITCQPSIDDLATADVVQYIRAQQKLESPLSHSLKDIIVDWFNGFNVEMEFLRLLLLGAVALRQLRIGNSSADPEHQYDLHMLETLASFHRASPGVDIMVDCPHRSQH